jgi:hypothetical protein
MDARFRHGLTPSQQRTDEAVTVRGSVRP